MENYCPDTESLSPLQSTDSIASRKGTTDNPDAQYLNNTDDGTSEVGSGQGGNSSGGDGEVRKAYVLSGPELIRLASTRPLRLTDGDVIYFMVNIVNSLLFENKASINCKAFNFLCDIKIPVIKHWNCCTIFLITEGKYKYK